MFFVFFFVSIQLLVTAFAPFFQNPKNAHLKNFFLIIPPLTLNFIEHLLSAKDKISKKNKDGAGHFTDDGFAMGIAYILKLLNQTSNFNSLHWFKSIRAKYIYDKEKLIQQTQTADKNDEKLQQTLLLTDRRITAFQQEFDLLYYNLSSAKIFFQ
jgi:WASH complex subunit 7